MTSSGTKFYIYYEIAYNISIVVFSKKVLYLLKWNKTQEPSSLECIPTKWGLIASLGLSTTDACQADMQLLSGIQQKHNGLIWKAPLSSSGMAIMSSVGASTGADTTPFLPGTVWPIRRREESTQTGC